MGIKIKKKLNIEIENYMSNLVDYAPQFKKYKYFSSKQKFHLNKKNLILNNIKVTI